MRCRNCRADITNGKKVSLCLIDERDVRIGIECKSCFAITERESMTQDAVLGDEPTVEQLKCCGNCINRDSMDNGNDYNDFCLKHKHLASWNYCDDWEWDGLKRYDRTDEFTIPD